MMENDAPMFDSNPTIMIRYSNRLLCRYVRLALFRCVSLHPDCYMIVMIILSLRLFDQKNEDKDRMLSDCLATDAVYHYHQNIAEN